MSSFKKFIAGIVGIVLGGLVIGLVFGGSHGSSEAQIQLREGIEAEAQSVSDRTWLPQPNVQAAVYGTHRNPLYNPSYVGIDGQKNVFVLDRGESRVKKFTPEGDFVTSFGNGSGQGPGEFTMITDVDVANDGRVAVTDSENSRITVFGPDRNDVEMVSLRRSPYRMGFASSSQFIAMPMPGSQDNLFTLLDTRGNSLNTFGRIIEDQQQNALALDSRVVGDETGSVFFVPRKAGLIGSFGTDGTLRFLRKTIEGHGLPTVVRKGSVRYVDRSAPTVAYSASVSSDGVHVHTGADSSGTRVSALDTYDRTTGEYLYSTRIPTGMSRFAYMDDSRLYVVNDTAVIAWERRFPQTASDE